VFVHSRTTAAAYDVVLVYSYDGGDRINVTPSLITTNTGEGYTISSPFTDRTKFGLFMRFILNASLHKQVYKPNTTGAHPGQDNVGGHHKPMEELDPFGALE
jgi:hypothetical protein